MLKLGSFNQYSAYQNEKYRIEKTTMELQIETTTYSSNRNTYISKQDDFVVTYMKSSMKADFSHELSEKDFAEGVIKLVEVGSISVYRVNLMYSDKNLAILADLVSQDLCFAASFFLFGDRKDSLFSRYLFYIDEVFIHPKYRRSEFGRKGLECFWKISRREKLFAYILVLFEI